jgi:mRNA interferase RelE/StbE
MYKARFSKTFLRKEKKLSSDVKQRVIEVIEEVLINPYAGVSLAGPLKGLWRVRVGKYRIIYEIDEKEKIVIFHDVDLRKRIY